MHSPPTRPPTNPQVAGAVHLDSATLPKLRASHDMLVCFDKYIPYGGKHDTFKAIAQQIGELGEAGGDFLVAWVGLQEYGDELNKDLHEEYGIDPQKLPAYKFFKKETQEVIDYKGAKTAKKKILAFIEEHAGIYTTVKPGCVPKFDEMAKQYVADGADRAALKAKAEEMVAAYKSSDDKESQAAAQ